MPFQLHDGDTRKEWTHRLINVPVGHVADLWINWDSELKLPWNVQITINHADGGIQTRFTIYGRDRHEAFTRMRRALKAFQSIPLRT